MSVENTLQEIVNRMDILRRRVDECFANIVASGGSSPPSGTGLVRVTSGAYDARAELSGDVTTSGSLVTTIADGVVTNAKLDDMPAATVKGSIAGGVPDDLTMAELAALLPISQSNYFPTVTSIANLDAVTALSVFYIRIITAVTLWGSVNVNPTAAATLTRLRFTLPVASNFTGAAQAGGTGGNQADGTEPCVLLADAVNDEIEIRFIAVNTSNHTLNFMASYVIL